MHQGCLLCTLALPTVKDNLAPSAGKSPNGWALKLGVYESETSIQNLNFKKVFRSIANELILHIFIRSELLKLIRLQFPHTLGVITMAAGPPPPAIFPLLNYDGGRNRCGTVAVVKTACHGSATGNRSDCLVERSARVKWWQCLAGTFRQITILAEASLSMVLKPPCKGWWGLASGARCGPPLCWWVLVVH